MIRTTNNMRRKRDEGYILLLAVLISSIILAISLGVYSIGLKQFVLSGFVSESQKALVAADRGIECFMYWDGLFRDNGLQDNSGQGTSNTMFPQPQGSLPLSTDISPPNWPPANINDSAIGICAGQKINNSTAWGTNGPHLFTDNNSVTWIKTDFNLLFNDNSSTTVQVFRKSNFTKIISTGSNTSDTNSLRQTIRIVEVDASI